jgi:type IV pilus assembly protein PilA
MNRFFKSLKRQDGFTLVELMVVVAIIGLLSAVAIPNFQKYQAKAKSAEGKLQLSAVYTAEVSFFSDFSIYHVCLSYMGYDSSNESLSRYYTVGFNAVTGFDTTAISNAVNSGLDVTACPASAAESRTIFTAQKRIVASIAPAGASELGASATNGDQGTAAALIFKAGAAGFISKDKVAAGTSSLMTIDQNKLLSNVRPGF